ncbi:SDR family oxidoreductase, partial [Shewanella sp.]
AVAQLALLAKQQAARLIHLSSDYVFDGRKNSPYLCSDTPSPTNHYGHSKLEGERGVLSLHNPNSCIVRTSWLYGGQGPHFVTTMLNLMQTKDELKIVADQRGSPTYVVGLAQFIWALCQMKTLSSIYHWSDMGVCSWFEFAVEIQRQALTLGILKQPISLLPISSEQYPSKITRPAYSALECQNSSAIYPATPWEIQLRHYLLSYQQSINHRNNSLIL